MFYVHLLWILYEKSYRYIERFVEFSSDVCARINVLTASRKISDLSMPGLAVSSACTFSMSSFVAVVLMWLSL